MNDHKNECPVPQGKLIIIGGSEEKKDLAGPDAHQDVLKEFIRLCGHSPRIEIITTAGGEAIEETYQEYASCFKKLGAEFTGHIHHGSRLDVNKEMAFRLNNANGVFFTGGDQLKLTSIYGGTPMMTALKILYVHNDIVIGGTSAGAMAMSTPMIYAGSGETEMIAGEVKITTGFEFMKDVCIDTHFVHRGRFVRMAQVIATNPACIGVGIEENTAIVITEGKKARVVGCGVVIIADGENSYGSNIAAFDENKKITIRDLKVSILSHGETFEIPARNPSHL
jgi:cyanophycinase